MPLLKGRTLCQSPVSLFACGAETVILFGIIQYAGEKMKNPSYHTRMLLLMLILLGLGACKLQLDQEIWLNADNSGRARLEAEGIIPRMAEGEDETNGPSDENALQDYADRIAENSGAVMELYEMSTDHNPDELRYIYQLEFSFDNLQTLRNVICIDSTRGFNVDQATSYKLADIDPHNLLMQQESDIQEYFSLMDINMKLVLHLPNEPKKIDSKAPALVTGKEIIWNFTLDQDWYSKPLENILIMF